MKKLFVLAGFAALLLACSNNSTQASENKGNNRIDSIWGDKFDTSKAIDATSFIAAPTLETPTILRGKVLGVCKEAGCWFTVSDGKGGNMFVKLMAGSGIDDELVIPKDCEGQTIYFYGKAKKKTISVEEQKHYAEDAGKSKEEIAAITQPKEELRFTSSGVVLLFDKK